MTDIIWGNVGKVLSGQIFELNLTHRKDGNKNDYSDIEKIKIIETDIVTLPANPSDCTKEQVEQVLSGLFVKCEIKERGDEGNLLASISHSGQGGY
ncbi:MAG: hypothetical protein ACE5RN_08770 [Nitrosopumilaceae archaeon]